MHSNTQAWQGFSSSSSRQSTLLLLFSPLILALPLCIAIFAIQIFVICLLRSHMLDSNWVRYGDSIADVAIRTMPNNALLAVSVISFVLYCCIAVGFGKMRRNRTGNRRLSVWGWLMVIAAALNFVLDVAITAAVFVKQHGEKIFSVYDEEIHNIKKVATRETWLCSLHTRSGDGVQLSTWAGPGCSASKAGRWLMVCLTVVAALCLILSVWLVLAKDKASGRDSGAINGNEEQPPPYDGFSVREQQGMSVVEEDVELEGFEDVKVDDSKVEHEKTDKKKAVKH